MSMLEWVKEEIHIASEHSNQEPYIISCYQSALKAYECLLEDNHSGMSIEVTRDILNHLIKCKPLSPIEDREEDWIPHGIPDQDKYRIESYQHKRYPSLFKDVYKNGEVKYIDVDRVQCFELNRDICFSI